MQILGLTIFFTLYVYTNAVLSILFCNTVQYKKSLRHLTLCSVMSQVVLFAYRLRQISISRWERDFIFIIFLLIIC